MNKKGFSLIELIFVIFIFAILSAVMIDLLYNTVDYYDLSINNIKTIQNTELMFNQIQDETRHALKLESNNLQNLNMLTYDSSDPGNTIPVNYIYNFFNNKLYKYSSVADDTQSFETEFSNIEFNVLNKNDTYLEMIVFNADNRKEYVIYKKRNK
jgi:prepilin-type N-terminal cleavage/methylation domain-containing protein